jgi:hypothetical protein
MGRYFCVRKERSRKRSVITLVHRLRLSREALCNRRYFEAVWGFLLIASMIGNAKEELLFRASPEQ